MDIRVLNANIIRLKLIPGIGNKTIRTLLNNSPELEKEDLQIDFILPYLTEKQQDSCKQVWNSLESLLLKELEAIEKQNIKIVNIIDVQYPESLRKTFDAPVLLFYKGDFSYDYHTSLAVVGSRKSTIYGEQACTSFISRLGEHHFTIVSGLALGVDAIAHNVALENNCKCIGVIGNGLNHIYPSSNTRLYSKILDSAGCIISEFLPSTEPIPAFFPLRNRIIAGLTRGTLVVEAAEKSGSLITAQNAFEENRDVYAIPADINRIQSSGCNRLIQKQIAKLVLSPEDIIKDYGLNTLHEKSLLRNFENHPHKDLLQLITFNKLTVDEISVKTGKPVHDVNAILTELEMDGLVTSDEQMCWFRI